jgi:hypothetical protein
MLLKGAISPFTIHYTTKSTRLAGAVQLGPPV